MTPHDAAQKIIARFSGREFSVHEFRGETTLECEQGLVAEVAAFCKQELGFLTVTDITGLDFLDTEEEARGRFAVVYELYHHGSNVSLRLKVRVPEDHPVVPSVTPVWAGADWHEREVYDMLGVKFENHPDLRRILMWEGYPYFPLRKDFPLAGKPTNLPEVAFSQPAPLEGGPFVTRQADLAHAREPRAKVFEKQD